MATPISIDVSSIIEGSRARQDKNYGDLTDLANSLKTYGSIQPIVLEAKPDGTVHLVAGGRRLRAMKSLKTEKIYKNSVLNPHKLGYCLVNELSEHHKREIELEENLRRLGMTWIDSVLSIYHIHRLRKAQNAGKWGNRQTAELLGHDGMCSVNYALRAATALLKGDKEIMECDSLKQANQIFIKRKEEEGIRVLQERAAKKLGDCTPATTAETPGIAVTGLGGPTKELLEALDSLDEETPSSGLSITHTAQTTISKVQVPFSKMFLRADFRDVTLPRVHHIVTDIPYGIDMDNLDEKQVADVKAEHGIDYNISLMQPFLKAAFDAVMDRGFCVFFYDLDHHEKLQTWAKEAGWRVQRWPYIACKSSNCRNQAAQYNTTKNYEVAMFLRKDEKTVLRRAVNTSFCVYDFAAERQLYNNPFAKPFDLWKDIYDMIAFQGQSVLDPFAGEMSACRAAANCGLVPYGIEKVQQHYERGIHHMKTVYNLIHKNNCEFV